MDNSFAVTDQSKVRRSPHRGTYGHAEIHEILDAGFVCQVGFVDDNMPVIIPMSYGRKDNTLYLHGASTSRMINILTTDNPICINVTFVDGIVVARSMFDTSVNYRSVVIFGRAQLLPENEKMEALRHISEHILPGRWDEVRSPLPKEMKATTILKVSIEMASAKIRKGPPLDEDSDLDSPVWAGEIPLKAIAGMPVGDPLLKAQYPLPSSVQKTIQKYS